VDANAQLLPRRLRRLVGQRVTIPTAYREEGEPILYPLSGKETLLMLCSLGWISKYLAQRVS
jgi:hypothetical protein